MLKPLPLALVALTAAVLSPCLRAASEWNYPATRTVAASDTYFGKTYLDPYRWLEDQNSKEVADWFKAQATLTDDILSKIPARDALANEWLELAKLRPARYADIDVENGRVFYKKTLGTETVGKLYYRNGLSGAEQLLLDPNTYKPGVQTTIGAIVPSHDGALVAVGLTSGGAELGEIRVVDVASGKLLPDTMGPSYGSYGWALDNKSFFYDIGKVNDLKSMDFKLNRKTRIHVLGQDTKTDIDFLSNESNPELGITPKEYPAAFVDETCPEYVFGQLSTVESEMKVYYAPMSEVAKGKARWDVLCSPSDNLVHGFQPFDGVVYAITHQDARHYKLVKTSLAHPDWKHAETAIPEAADSLQGITRSKDYIFLTYSNGIVSRIVRFNPKTGATDTVKLPMSGSVSLSVPDWHSNHCLVDITGWTQILTIYDFDADSGAFTKSIFNSDVVYPGFDRLVSEEVEVTGRDGVKVPLSIIHVKGMPMDGSTPCILEGYGAYGYSIEPYCSVMHSVVLHGAILAFAHVRGGGENGEDWYRAGYKATKHNTWEDFIACAEYLVSHGYTSPAHLAGTGTSAGGILISRAITERPDLFAAAVCNVGCANAMRMEFSPNGPGNIPEFGTVKTEAECKALYEMDGVQHVKAGVKYPALMGVGGWNDPRVMAWEPGKFVAAVQAASTSGKPALMKVNYDNGHFTEDKKVTFLNFSAQEAFLLWQTGLKEFQPVR